LIDQLYQALQASARKETAYCCLDWVCRNIKYENERGDGWPYPSEAITKGETDCEEQAFALAATTPQWNSK